MLENPLWKETALAVEMFCQRKGQNEKIKRLDNARRELGFTMSDPLVCSANRLFGTQDITLM